MTTKKIPRRTWIFFYVMVFSGISAWIALDYPFSSLLRNPKDPLLQAVFGLLDDADSGFHRYSDPIRLQIIGIDQEAIEWIAHDLNIVADTTGLKTSIVDPEDVSANAVFILLAEEQFLAHGAEVFGPDFPVDHPLHGTQDCEISRAINPSGEIESTLALINSSSSRPEVRQCIARIMVLTVGVRIVPNPNVRGVLSPLFPHRRDQITDLISEFDRDAMRALYVRQIMPGSSLDTVERELSSRGYLN